MSRKPWTTRGGATALAVLLLLVVSPPWGGSAWAAGKPSRPAGLRAVKVSGRAITLRWRPSARARFYRAFRNGHVRARALRGTRFHDGAVSRFTAYTYSVAACNRAGCSRRSTITVVTHGGSCRGVGLTPRSNIQRAISRRRQGTTFCLSRGTYHIRTPIIPKSYDVIWGARGATFVGGGTTASALVGHSYYQHSIRVRGLTITRFAGTDAIASGNGWIVEGNRVGYNGAIGVRAQNGSTVRGNFIHHNGLYGIAGSPHLSHATFRRNIVAYNNSRHLYGGGAKIILASRVSFLRNYVHDNWGPGLHCDTDCIHIVFAGNRVTGNRGVGIFYERGFAAVIRNNVVSGNDREVAGRSVFYGSQIHLNDSSGVEVFGNRVAATVRGTNGIGLVDFARGSGRYGTYRIANDYVHDNFIVLRRGGMSGMAGTAHHSRTLNNRFRHNHYRVYRVRGRHFAWVELPIRWRKWRSHGQDHTGTIRPL
jgi:parallel beta helix pectate lyase-like protein